MFSRYLTLCNPMDCSPTGSSVPGDSLGKNTGVGCHALLQRIFPTQGSNVGLQVPRQLLLPAAPCSLPDIFLLPLSSKSPTSASRHFILFSRLRGLQVGLPRCVMAEVVPSLFLPESLPQYPAHSGTQQDEPMVSSRAATPMFPSLSLSSPL